jgi:hypothetical protein
MHKRIKETMDNDENVIYDATNLSRKRRIAFLESIKKYNYHTSCYLFITPVDVCKERNSHRKGFARVPDEVYDRMLRSFNTPMLSEGWDEILPIFYYGRIKFDYDFNDLKDFSQNNAHHTLSLGDHMYKAFQYTSEHCDSVLKNINVLIAARYHDIGKCYTKSFKNSHGEPTEAAHYYGHENYGAYIYLIYWLANRHVINISFADALEISQLINWHMAPLLRWNKSEKALNKDLKLIGEDFYNKIMLINEADLFAH